MEGAVLTGAPVTAIDQSFEFQASFLSAPQDATLAAEETAAGLSYEPEIPGAFRRAVDKGGGLQGRVDRDEAFSFGPVDGFHTARPPPGRNQGPRRLQAGEDADVVLGRRAAENDPDYACPGGGVPD